MLAETGMMGSRPVDTPIDSNIQFSKDEGEDFVDANKYKRLVGGLIYLTMTRLDITFAVGVVSQLCSLPNSKIGRQCVVYCDI